MPLGTEVGLGRGHIVLDVDPKNRAQNPQFSAHVCCGKTAGWIKIPLGTEAGLGPGRKGHNPLISAHVYCGHFSAHVL